MEEIQLKVRAMERALMKYGKYIEELEKDVAILKAHSHPPIFTRGDYQRISDRLIKIEKKEK